MRRMAVLLFAAFAALASAQDWTPQGSVKSRQYENRIRDSRGNVEATEFFSLEYSVSIQIVELGEDASFLDCHNWCHGGHKAHAQCDFSCDERCPDKEHKKVLQGEYFPDLSSMRAATAAANGLAAKGGGTASPSDWSHRVSAALAEFRRESKKRHTLNMPHQGPCGHGWWKVGYKVKGFKVRGTMTKTGFTMRGGVRTPINETVGTHEQQVATGKFAQSEPMDQNQFVLCECRSKEEVQEERSRQAFIDWLNQIPDPKLKEEAEWSASPNGLICRDPQGNLLFDAKLDVTAEGNDMNTVRLILTNKSGETVRVTLPPGVIFVPSSPAFQIMMSLMAAETTLAAQESRELYLSVAPSPLPDQAQIQARWGCLEIKKKEPDSSVKYRLKGRGDDALAALSAITARSRFRGPHDQARLWIYTDKAPLSEINKRMIPGVSPGRYAMLLRDVAMRGGADFTQSIFKTLVLPELLTGLNFDDEAVRWVAGFLAETKAKDLTSYVNGNTSKFLDLVAKEGKDGASNLAWVVGSLLQDGSLDLRKAAAKLILAVLPGQRGLFAEAGGLEEIRWLLASGNEELCSLALDVLEAFGSAGRDLALASMEALPTEPLRQRAAKIAGVNASGNENRS